MLKVVIKTYNSLNGIYTNEHEFCASMSKYQLFDWARMNFMNNLRYEFWDDLGRLEIDTGDNKSVIIQVEEIDSIRDIMDLDYIVKNKYIKTS